MDFCCRLAKEELVVVLPGTHSPTLDVKLVINYRLLDLF